MNGIFYKRCGCTVAGAGGDGRSSAGPSGRVERRQLGASCPRLKLPDGSWSPDHGTWYLQIDAPGDVPGRTIHLRHGGYATRQDAEQQAAVVRALLATAEDAAEPTLARVEIARAIRALLASGDRLPSPLAVTDRIRNGRPPVPPTVAGWLREWLGAKDDIRPTTLLNYTFIVEHYLIPLLGRYRLDALRPDHVQTALDQIRRTSAATTEDNLRRRTTIEAAASAWHAHDAATARRVQQVLGRMPPFHRPASAATVQRIRAVLRSALSDALRRQLITVNAAALVKLPAAKPPRALEWTTSRITVWRDTGVRPNPVMVWTVEQTRTFLDATPAHRLHALFTLLAHTGMRRGEACGLRWEDVDLDTATVTIRRQLVQVGTATAIGPPKTAAGQRTITLAPAVVTTLARHLRIQRELFQTLGTDWSPAVAVFTNADGTALRPQDVTDVFKRLIRTTGLPPIRLHDLRHGVATHALDAGVPAKAVSDLLGHSSIVVTLDLYPAASQKTSRATADTIAAQLDPRGAARSNKPTAAHLTSRQRAF